MTNSVEDESLAELDANARPVAKGWKRYAYVGVGGLFFIIGVLGVILPMLPATPFFLLTSYFLVRSSPRLNNALLRSRFIGPILIDWQENGGVRRNVKVKAVVLVVIAVSVSLYFSAASFWPTVIVLLLASLGITVIARLPLTRVHPPS